MDSALAGSRVCVCVCVLGGGGGSLHQYVRKKVGQAYV